MNADKTIEREFFVRVYVCASVVFSYFVLFIRVYLRSSVVPLIIIA